MSPAKLVSHHEESEEMGGYFIVNGNEKIIRFLIVPRRNHVTSLIRSSFANRGNFYTTYATQIRCVRPDQTSQTNTLHYLSNGTITFRFSWRKNEFMVPVVMLLKALIGASDQEIFTGLAQNAFDDTFRTDRIELLLRNFQYYSLPTASSCLDFLGSKFRVVLGCPDDWDSEQIGRYLLQRIVLVHLKDPISKYRLLLFVMVICCIQIIKFLLTTRVFFNPFNHYQFYDSETLRTRSWRVLCGQSRFCPTSRGSLTRAFTIIHYQGTLRRIPRRHPSRHCQ